MAAAGGGTVPAVGSTGDSEASHLLSPGTPPSPSMETGSKVALDEQKQGFTLRLTLAIFSSTLGMFSFGYNTGVINAPQSVIESFYNETFVNREGYADRSIVELLWSFTVAIFAVGGMAGGLAGAWWADKFGRKRGMVYNTFVGIVGSLLMGLSEVAASYEMVIIGRFIIGVNCGLYTALSPMYNSEVSPPAIRGAVGTINQLGVTTALLISQVLGLDFILGTEQLWPVLLGLSALPLVLQLLTLPLSPESPSYLAANNQPEAALEALMTLRGASSSNQVASEMEELTQGSDSSAGEEAMSFVQVLRMAWLRKPLLIALIMHLSQQLSGINCIFYYSTTLFEQVGLSTTEAQYATLGVGGIMVVMTLVTVPLMDVAGRRTLHLTGLAGIFIFSIVFTITFTHQDKAEWVKYIAITSALLIVVFFALGPGSIPWMIVAELFSQGPRAVAVSLAVLINWLANFVVGLSFTSLLNSLGTLVFIPFTVFVFIFFLALFFLLPETKNKTIDEITALFGRPSSQDKNADAYAPPEYRTFDNTPL